MNISRSRLAFGLLLLTSLTSAKASPLRCPDILKKIGLRMILKDSKKPVSFGSSAFFIKSSERRNLLQRAVAQTHKTLFRESAHTDAMVSLIDGPIAKATQQRYGKQKELTLFSNVIVKSGQSIAVAVVMHALFKDSNLDPVVWANRKEELKSTVGVESNHDDLEYYMRLHPDFWDIHREYLNALKQDPKTSMTPYLKQVRERMDEIALVQEEIAQLIHKDGNTSGNQTSAPDYKTAYETLHNPKITEESLNNLSPNQQAIINRLSFAQQLASNESDPPAPLRQLKSAFRNMFATLKTVENGEDLSALHMKSNTQWTSSFLNSPQGMAKMDAAINAVLTRFGNQYWQNDIHINPEQKSKWVEAYPLYNHAIDRMLNEEKSIHEEIQEIKSQAKHSFYFQSALKQYNGATLNLEWQKTLDLLPTDADVSDPLLMLNSLHAKLKDLNQLRSTKSP